MECCEKRHVLVAPCLPPTFSVALSAALPFCSANGWVDWLLRVPLRQSHLLNDNQTGQNESFSSWFSVHSSSFCKVAACNQKKDRLSELRKSEKVDAWIVHGHLCTQCVIAARTLEAVLSLLPATQHSTQKAHKASSFWWLTHVVSQIKSTDMFLLTSQLLLHVNYGHHIVQQSELESIIVLSVCTDWWWLTHKRQPWYTPKRV